MASRKRRPKKGGQPSKKSRHASTHQTLEKAPAAMRAEALPRETEAVAAKPENTVPAEAVRTEDQSESWPSPVNALPEAACQAEAPTAVEARDAVEPGAENPSEPDAHAVASPHPEPAALALPAAEAPTAAAEPAEIVAPNDQSPCEPQAALLPAAEDLPDENIPAAPVNDAAPVAAESPEPDVVDAAVAADAAVDKAADEDRTSAAAPSADVEISAAPAERDSETSPTARPDEAPALRESQAQSASVAANEPQAPTPSSQPDDSPEAPKPRSPADAPSSIGIDFSASPAAAMLAAGGVLAAAGLLLFAAAHWLGWPPLVRLGVFGAMLVMSALPLLFQTIGRDGRATARSRRRAGIASLGYAAALGLFLAAHGQTYQTGAGASTLCALWFALLLPWVLWLRRPGIFIAAFLIGLAATVLPLWENSVRFEPSGVLEGLFPAALFSAVPIWILAPLVRRAPPSNTSLRAALLVPAIAAVAFVQAGIPAVVGIDEGLTPVYLALTTVTAGLLWLTRRPEGRALAVLAAGLWANGLCFDVFSLSNGWAVSAALLFDGFLLWAIARAAGRTESEHSLLNAAPRIAAGLLALVAIGLLLALGSIYADLSALPYLGAGYAALGIIAGAALRIREQQASPAGTTIRLAALVFAFAGAAIIALSAGRAIVLGALSSQGVAGIILILAALALPSRLALAAGGLLLGYEFDVMAPMGVAALAAGTLAALIRPQGAGLARALLLLSWALLLAASFAGDSTPDAWNHWDHWMTAAALGSLVIALAPLFARGGRAAALPMAAAAAVTAAVFLTKNAAGLTVMPILAAFLVRLANCSSLSSLGKAPGRPAAEPCFLSLLSAGTLAAIYAQAPASGENLLLEASLDLLIAAAAWLAAGAWLRRRAKRTARTARRRLSAVSLVLAGATAALLALGVLRDARDLAQAPRFLAAIAPADPRDILMGDFMTLRFDLLPPALQGEADRLRAGAEALQSDGAIRLALAAPNGHLVATAFLGLDDVPPEGTVTTTFWRAEDGTAMLPERWYFPSGDAGRFEAARFAALRCTANRCLIEGLADESGRLIEPAGPQASLSVLLRCRFGIEGF